MIYDFSFQIETTENSESDNNMIFIVVAVLVAVVLLAVIGAVTYLIGKKWKRKENTPRSIESGTTNVNEVVHTQPAPVVQNGIAMNPINPQPHIAVHAPTPGHHMPGIYPQGPMFVRPLFGSTNSDHSHSSTSVGYESGTDCSCTRYSPYASNHQPPRCSHCDRYCYTHIPQHQQHHQQQLQEQPEDEQDNGELVNNQQQPPATTNLSNSKSSVRRNLSDPNISRHKQPPSRSLVDQRTTKLLSSSSVV